MTDDNIYVQPTEPGTLRDVVERWYADASGYEPDEPLADVVRSDLNDRLFRAGFNPVVLERHPPAISLGDAVAGRTSK